MDIAILNIGDELLAGKILNTNQFDIARKVTPLGHSVTRALVVGDDESAIVDALESILGRAGSSRKERSSPDVLILTGGLGPTRDDLTRQAVAAWLGVEAGENPEALAWLAEFLRKPVEEIPPGQRLQASVPAGTDPLRNPAGTACGFSFASGSTRVYAFPGVPAELDAMADLHLLPSLLADRVFLQKGLWTWGWSEGDQRQALEGFVLPAGFHFSSLPGDRGVRLSLSGAFPVPELEVREAELEAAWKALTAVIPPDCLVDLQGLDLPAAVFARLLEQGATLSVAESCTGGGLGALLTETPGSSAVFERGFLTYSNRAKVDLLGVPGDVLEVHGAVSEETALAMAKGCLERSGAAYACSITGIAGPDGGTPEKPVGTVWIAVAGAASAMSSGLVEAHARRFRFRGDRHTVRRRSALSALNLVRLFIQGKSI
jgi:nicotinamide-nucleotide amidase